MYGSGVLGGSFTGLGCRTYRSGFGVQGLRVWDLRLFEIGWFGVLHRVTGRGSRGWGSLGPGNRDYSILFRIENFEGKCLGSLRFN